MTHDELNARLARLRLCGAELSRRLGRTVQQVSAWRKGHAPVPAYVGAYLAALDRIAELTATDRSADLSGGKVVQFRSRDELGAA